MHRSLRRAPAALVFALAAIACHSDAGVAPGASLSLGQSRGVTGPQTLNLDGGSTGADYYAVLVNTNQTAGASEPYSLSATGIAAPTTLLGSLGDAMLDRSGIEDGASKLGLQQDRAFETRLRARERQLIGRFPGARAWRAARSSPPATAGASASRIFDPTRRNGALPAGVQVGDIVTVNVNGDDPCTNPVYHAARVAAIGTHGIVLNDTLNPSGGFTTADFQRYAARFDTLVYPLDSAAFGPPTDIDGNGHVGLIFTRAVNALTPANADSYVGGFTFSRDLFPATANELLDACTASNQGEFFYLLTPDPNGTINGNKRTAGFVDTNTTAVIAHEFQHLINAGRRIYLNDASEFEDTWLDEGLAHIAEELLFYREAGIAPKQNLDTPRLRASDQRRTAFNLDMLGNAGRYQSYLRAPSKSSPYADDDSLSTRGAAWSLLRYLADRSGRTDNAFFFALANSTKTGIANLTAVYGSDLAGAVRDWSASNAVDDIVSAAPELQQPSWNWHSIYVTLNGSYPLSVAALTDGGTAAGSIVAGGAAYYRMGVPAGSSASLRLSGSSSTAATNLQLVVVRTR
jgi:hypothetical protein